MGTSRMEVKGTEEDSTVQAGRTHQAGPVFTAALWRGEEESEQLLEPHPGCLKDSEYS